MAGPYYVRSPDGSNADTGLTWALAKADLTSAAGAFFGTMAAGEICWISQSHAETSSGNRVYVSPGTPANPCHVICGNDAAEPPTALATGGAISTTGSGNITFGGSARYVGLTISIGTGASAANLQVFNASDCSNEFNTCTLRLPGTSTPGSFLAFGSTTSYQSQRLLLKNTTLRFGHTSSGIKIQQGYFHWNGGGIESGGTAIIVSLVNLIGFGTNANSGYALLENLDLVNLGAACSIFRAPNMSGGTRALIRNCKLPISWTGGLVYGAWLGMGPRAVMVNCMSSGGTLYRLWVEDYSGSVRDETTNIHTGGATDGTTPISWKMVTSANAGYPTATLVTEVIRIWNDATGVTKTLTVEFAQDAAATELNNDEIWMDVSFQGTAGQSLGTNKDNAITIGNKYLAGGNEVDAHTSSSVTWAGLTNPTKQKLVVVTDTIQQKGWFICRINLAKASTTVYVDPMITVA